MKRKWKILSFLGVCSQEVIWFFCYCLIVTLMFGGVTEAAPGGEFSDIFVYFSNFTPDYVFFFFSCCTHQAIDNEG